METLNETTSELLNLIHINQPTVMIEKLDEAESRYVKDLKVNLSNVLQSQYLTAKEIALLGLAVASNNKNSILIDSFIKMGKENEASDTEIAESIACASLLAGNNIFYRFRHFTDKESYQKMPAKIKMNIMMNPILGKEFFELVSLAVSAVNGCEMCVKAHEDSVLKHGSSEERVWDTIRLTSVIISLEKIVY